MRTPDCPVCKKSVQHRHTYMASFPLTLVCAGCGSWLQLDVKRSGTFAVLLMVLVTMGLAYFSPYFLILLPVYFVLSMGPLQRFSVDVVKKRKAELWTINRRTGALRPMNDAEKDAQHDLALSGKLTGVRPFRVATGELKGRKCKIPEPRTARPRYRLDDLPTGLPN